MKTVDNFRLIQPIGAGAYGTVFMCKIRKENKIEPDTRKRMRPGRRVVCKMIKRQVLNGKLEHYFKQEIHLMVNLQHKNLLRFLEAKLTKNNIYIFMEFCNGGDLRRLLEVRGGRLDENLTKKIIAQIATGLNYLNDNEAMHRDLKLENLFLHFPNFTEEGIVSDEYLKNFDPNTEEIEVIIGDLGFARTVTSGDIAQSF